MRLVLVRHGETSHNREGRVQGQNDLGLTSEGRRQAEAVAVSLKGACAEALYASPLRRTMETAEPLARELGLAVIPAEGLMELDTGQMDGLAPEEMRQRYPEFMEQWRLGATWAAVPGGESLDHLQERAWRAVEEMAAGHPAGTVIVVTHNFTIVMVLCRALELPNPLFRRLRHGLASVTTLEQVRERWVLVGLNDTCHLALLQAPTPEGT